jgi:hypothetical protein
MDGTVPQSIKSFIEPCTHAAQEIMAPMAFLGCQGDLILPFEAQRAMASAAGARFIEVGSGHSPFLDGDRISSIVDTVETIA